MRSFFLGFFRPVRRKGKEVFRGRKNHGETKKKSILSTTLQNNSSKIIFEDNTLCCQFLNDYIDLPHFKEVRPEDIRDVSAEFVPQFSNERQADRIKEIKIRGEKDITPFFLISLIEHKSDVEYNIHMQIFRYMVYIWASTFPITWFRCMITATIP